MKKWYKGILKTEKPTCYDFPINASQYLGKYIYLSIFDKFGYKYIGKLPNDNNTMYGWKPEWFSHIEEII